MRELTPTETSKVSGGLATVAVNGNHVTVTTAVYFSGPAATSANIQKVISSAASWNTTVGNITISTNITSVSDPNQAQNEIQLYSGAVPGGNNNGHSFTDVNHGTGEWSMADFNGVGLPNGTSADKGSGDANGAHEWGHVFGLKDIIPADPQHPDLMDDSHATAITKDDVQGIVDFRYNKVTQDDGSVPKESQDNDLTDGSEWFYDDDDSASGGDDEGDALLMYTDGDVVDEGIYDATTASGYSVVEDSAGDEMWTAASMSDVPDYGNHMPPQDVAVAPDDSGGTHH